MTGCSCYTDRGYLGARFSITSGFEQESGHSTRNENSRVYHSRNVNIRLTHPKKSAAEHRVIIALGVIGQEAPATLDAGSDTTWRVIAHEGEIKEDREIRTGLSRVTPFRHLE